MNQKDRVAIEGIIKELKALIQETKPKVQARRRVITMNKEAPNIKGKSTGWDADGNPRKAKPKTRKLSKGG